MAVKEQEVDFPAILKITVRGWCEEAVPEPITGYGVLYKPMPRDHPPTFELQVEDTDLVGLVVDTVRTILRIPAPYEVDLTIQGKG